MTSWRYRDSRWADRLEAPIEWNSSISLVAVLAGIFLIVGAAAIIARDDSAEEVASHAHILTWSESVASSGEVLQAEVRQGLVVGQAAAFGVLDQEAPVESAARIREAIAELEQRVASLTGITDADGIREFAALAADQAASVAEAIETGDVDTALTIAEDQLGATFEQLSTRATAVSQRSAENISAVGSGLGPVATAARFIAALVIPGLAVLLLYRALRRSQKMSLLKTELARERELRQNKDAFVAAASHHVRAPLSAVVGFADLLRDSSRDFSPAVRDEVIELIAAEAEETANVVDDLLAAARYEAGELELAEERLEVRDVIDAATSHWAETQQSRLTIIGNAVIQADIRWLSHAMRNLLRTSAASGAEEIQVVIEEKEKRVVVAISDDGAAIPSEENERISEIYYTNSKVDGLAPSLGLGLAVARRIAKASGGDLRYQRLKSRNVFEMTLPRHKSHVLARDTFNRIIDPAAGMPAAEAIEIVISDGGPLIDYQPIVELSVKSPDARGVVGYEALARFPSHTARDWFAAASRMGLRLDLELACIRAAIAGFHPIEEDAFLAVNVSDETIQTPQLADVIADVTPRLVLELSETAPIASYIGTREALEDFSESGLRVAIDHVGSDGLNLDHVAKLEAWMIKIDMDLIRETRQSPRKRGLIRAILAMAEELDAFVVAVGIETEEQHDELTQLGVGFGQGHLYAYPRQLDSEDLAQSSS